MDNLKAIIVAAGLGTRLGHLTEYTPKCLIEINGRNLLQRQIDLLKKYNVDDIYVIIGIKGNCWTQKNVDQIRQICPKVIANLDNISTQNAYSLYLGLRNLNATVLAIDGDLFFEENFLKEVLSSPYKTLIVTKRAKNRNTPGSKVLTREDGKKIIAIGQIIKPNENYFPWEIHSGFIKINQKDLEEFKNECGNPKHYAKGLDEVLNSYCQNHEVYRISTKSRWVNINTPESLGIAKRIVGEREL